jgi:Zn-dependent protease
MLRLAFFNLLPFPPLDGSKILYTILPDSMKPAIEAWRDSVSYILLLAMQTESSALFSVRFSGVMFYAASRVVYRL